MAKYNPDEDIQNKQDTANQSEKMRKAKASGMNERDAVLASMKKTPKPPSVPGDGPIGISISSPATLKEEYPYGLRLDLGSEELDKLGIKDLPKVGDTFDVKAEAKVDSISQNHHSGDQPEKRVTLQITSMKVCEGGSGLDERDEDEEENPEHEASESPEEEAAEDEGRG